MESSPLSYNRMQDLIQHDVQAKYNEVDIIRTSVSWDLGFHRKNESRIMPRTLGQLTIFPLKQPQ